MPQNNYEIQIFISYKQSGKKKIFVENTQTMPLEHLQPYSHLVITAVILM